MQKLLTAFRKALAAARFRRPEADDAVVVRLPATRLPPFPRLHALDARGLQRRLADTYGPERAPEPAPAPPRRAARG